MTAANTEPWGRIKEFIYWLIINKPQPNLHSRDTCLGPEGVPCSTVIKVLVILVHLAYIRAEYIQLLIV